MAAVSPVVHVEAATGAIRSATAAVGRTLLEIETAEDWRICIGLVEQARREVEEMERVMRAEAGQVAR